MPYTNSFALASEKEEYSHKGGYIGTPGWYTIAGHHHCEKGSQGCVCTDPRKCFKTGNPPRSPFECRPDLDRYGAKPSSLCGAIGSIKSVLGGGDDGGHGGHHNGPSPIMLGIAVGIPLLLILAMVL